MMHFEFATQLDGLIDATATSRCFIDLLQSNEVGAQSLQDARRSIKVCSTVIPHTTFDVVADDTEWLIGCGVTNSFIC